MAGREGWVWKAVLDLVYGREGQGLARSGVPELPEKQQVSDR